MNRALTIAKREIRAYFGSPWSYAITAAFLAVSGYGFAWNPSTYLSTSLGGFVSWGGFFLLFLSPAITMRLFARESESGTLELLLTAPVKEWEVVLGKYMASVSILAAMLALSLYFPMMLFLLGRPDPGPILAGYIGIFLLGSVTLSAGLFSSSICSQQAVAFVTGSAINFLLWSSGHAAYSLNGPAREILRSISLSGTYGDFGRGLLESASLIYYLSLSALFLFLTIRVIESRRWR